MYRKKNPLVRSKKTGVAYQPRRGLTLWLPTIGGFRDKITDAGSTQVFPQRALQPFLGDDIAISIAGFAA